MSILRMGGGCQPCRRVVWDLVKMGGRQYDSAHMIDPSRRLVPSTVPEDHPIHDAAEAGELARVRAFLDQQPLLVHDINRAGGHPLHRAVIGGSADVVTLLLDRGADIHAI